MSEIFIACWEGDAWNRVESPLDISDAVAALGYLFLGAAAPCRDALDTDDNGSIDITDPIYLLNFILTST